MPSQAATASHSCWKKCNSRQNVSQSSTPLPLQKLFIVLTIQFGQIFGSVVLFPFLPFMVQDFFPELNKEELGRKAGYLGSAYFIGNFAGSMAWGWLSDAWGRRPTLLLGCIGAMFSSLLFGFSKTFATAVTARFLSGILSGNIGISKTYLSEILDDSNQAKGFSIFGVASGTARLMGSVVGGFLSQPASKYSLFESDFFCKYQYVLPMFVNAGIIGIGFSGAALFMEETLRKKSKPPSSNNNNDNTSIESDNSDSSDTTNIEMIRLTSESESEQPQQKEEEDTRTIETDLSDTDLLLQEENHLCTCVSVDIRNQPLSTRTRLKSKLSNIDYSYPFKSLYQRQKEQLIQCCFCFIPSRNTNYSTSVKECISPRYLFKRLINRIVLVLKLFVDKPVIVSVLLYAFLGGTVLILNEVLPLLFVTDHDHGGYNMDDNEIAVFIMIAGTIILFYQLLVYPRLIKLTGYRNMLRIKLIIFAISSSLIPWSTSITGPIHQHSYNVSESGSGSGMSPEQFDFCGYSSLQESVNQDSIKRLPVSVWIMLLVTLIPNYIARTTALVTAIVLVNNSTITATRGTVNGLGQSLVGIFRSIGPVFGALLFAWTESNGLSWPLNYHLTFEICSVLVISILIFTLCLPKSIEKKRIT